MKMTSAEANKMIRQLRDQIELIQENEREVYRFVAATTENVEDARPEYDYVATAEKLNDLEQKVRKIKHALSVFNVTTRLESVDMTIDEVLLFLPQASARLHRLGSMISKPPKSRAQNTGRTSIIEYEYLNYDIAVVRRDYDALMEKRTAAMTALDLVNNTVPFEVDI